LEHCWSLSRRILFDCIMWLGCAIPCRCALLVYSAGWSARSAVRSSVPSTVGPARPSRPSMTSADGASLPLAGAPARRQATPRRPAPPACQNMTSGATHSPHAPSPPLPPPAAHACFSPLLFFLCSSGPFTSTSPMPFPRIAPRPCCRPLCCPVLRRQWSPLTTRWPSPVPPLGRWCA